MREYEAGILRIEHCGPRLYLIEMSCGEIAREAVPGQFIEVRTGSGTDPFLRRPFSVAGADRAEGSIVLYVDVVGPGTGLLCSMRRGECVNVMGPLGSGFDTNLGGGGPCVLVGGGTGAAPLFFLAKRLTETARRKVTFMAGAKNADSLNAVESMCGGVTVMTATDDGSAGYHGFVSELLDENIDVVEPSAIYACGPAEMMRAVSRIAARRNIPCQVSLEERMACGLGVCLGCAVRLKDGRMVRSCVDGPVFDACEVFP